MKMKNNGKTIFMKEMIILKYAPTPMTKREVELVTNSVPFVHNWLKGKGIDFKICSDRNPADKSIPRVEL